MASKAERDAAAREKRKARKAAVLDKRNQERAAQGLGELEGPEEGSARDELLEGRAPKTMEELAKEDRRNNEDIINGMIKTAMEAEKIGAATSAQLDAQTAQMAAIDRDMGDMNDSLARSERVMRGMKSFGGKIKNVFSKGPKKREGSVVNGEQEYKTFAAKSEDEEMKRALEQQAGGGGQKFPGEEDAAERQAREQRLTVSAMQANSAKAQQQLSSLKSRTPAKSPLRDEAGSYYPRDGGTKEWQRGELELYEMGKGMFKKPKWTKKYWVCNEDYLFGYNNEAEATANNAPLIKVPLRDAQFEKYPEGKYDHGQTFGVIDKVGEATHVLSCDDVYNQRKWKDAICMEVRDALLDGGGRAGSKGGAANGVRLQDRQDLTGEEMRAEFDKQVSREDQQLDVLGGLMDNLAAQGLALNQQLKGQQAIIKHLDDNMDNTNARMAKATATAKTIK